MIKYFAYFISKGFNLNYIIYILFLCVFITMKGSIILQYNFGWVSKK